jgi:hypothetical protein
MEQTSSDKNANPSTTNTSGQGPSVTVPPEIQEWNWGAFFLTWIWGVGNKVWISLLALVPLPFAGLAISILLGIKGNEWAWQSKKWESIERFRRTQRIWMYWGIASLMAPFILILGIALIAVGILGYFGYIR